MGTQVESGTNRTDNEELSSPISVGNVPEKLFTATFLRMNS